MPEKLPYAGATSSDQRSVNDMFTRMVQGLSPDRRPKASRVREGQEPAEVWHDIWFVLLRKGRPTEDGLLTVMEFGWVWDRAKKARSRSAVDKAWRNERKNLAPWMLGEARRQHEEDVWRAKQAQWWRRFPDRKDILQQYQEEAMNLIWRQWVAELPWFEVRGLKIRARPAALDHKVCRVCAIPIEQKATGRTRIYCSPEHRQQREYERDRLVRALLDLKRRPY